MKTNTWQARIKVTQIPAEIENQIVRDYEKEKEVSIKKTFLTNPFSDQTVYGLELSLKNDFSWTFFISEKTQKKAFIKGYSYLRQLETMYPGLTAEIKVIHINTLEFNNDSEFHELVLAYRPRKFKIIEKLLLLFKKEKIGDLSFYFFWQRDDSVSRGGHHYNGEFQNYYKLKIFMRIDPHPIPNVAQPLYKAILKGYQEYLTIDILDFFKVRAKFEKRGRFSWYNIIRSNPMFDNPQGLVTGEFYKFIRNRIRHEVRFCFVHPALIDFTFPLNSPIRTANALKSMNYQYKSVSIYDENSIWIGKVINNGIVESNNVMMPISHFGASVFIGGQMRTGKTRLLTQISREFYKKAPNVGILYLNVGKANQEHLYQHDTVIKYGDPKFHVPYFVKGNHLDKSLQQTSAYLAASLGLREPVDKILKEVMRSFIRVNGELPASLRTLFKGLRKWYLVHPYDSEFQGRILTAIDNRVLTLLSDNVLDKCMSVPQNSSSMLPQWFLDWRNGKKVILDLSMCDDYVKLVLSSAIFQMIRTLTPDREVDGLQHLIVIDEAHVILEKSKEQFTNSDIFIAKEQLERIFNTLLREFRSKGLGFIITDVTPSDLFLSATKLPSVKILFRMGEECSRRFTHMIDDQKHLLLLEYRHALVLNGNNAERYSIKTIDIENQRALPLINNDDR